MGAQFVTERSVAQPLPLQTATTEARWFTQWPWCLRSWRSRTWKSAASAKRT